MTEFRLVDAGSINLGDEIQAIAARNFLPRVDRYPPRETLDRDPGSTAPIRTGDEQVVHAQAEGAPPRSPS